MAEEGIPFGISETTEPGAPLPGGMGITVAGYGEIDLSQAKPADGPSLVPVGMHADGSMCYHGIPEGAPQVIDGGRWHTCADGQQVLTSSPPGTPERGQDGWELTPTPCPACGAKDEVLVRNAVPGQEDLQGPWAYFCPVCGDAGTGHPRAAA